MGGGSGGGKFQGTRGSSVKISQGKMYNEGVHFRKHGRDMGFRSKKEYSSAARDFAAKYQNHPDAKVSEGTWGGSKGPYAGKVQRIISYDGKTVVLYPPTGQVVTFYPGTEYRGLNNIRPIR